MSSTYDRIVPIITDTYGESEFVLDMARHLAEKIDADQWDSRGREFGIMLICWNWFSGGSTADGVARKIEQELSA